MKFLTLAVLSVLLPMQMFAKPAPAAPPANARTIANLPNFPMATFKRSISPQLYRSLRVSPITAWIVTRAAVVGTSTANAKVIKSDASGAFDKMAIEIANNIEVSGTNTIESRARTDYITSNLLIYKIADGVMAITFDVNDDPRYQGYMFYAPAWVGIYKGGKWSTISSKPRKRSDFYPQPPGL